MQHELATWAEDDPNRRFDRLLRLIADRAWLAEAVRIVLAPSGTNTAGIDGIDKATEAARTGGTFGRSAHGPAERELPPAAGQANLYPES
jgi:RNA-directed DNA polymerase